MGEHETCREIATKSAEAISVVPNRDPVKGSSWPATGDGYVAWTDDQDSPPAHPDPDGDHLVLWSDGKGAIQLEPTAGMLLSAVGGGWLTWYDDWHGPLYLYGVRLSALSMP